MNRPASLGIPERAWGSGEAGDPQGRSKWVEYRYRLQQGHRKGVGLDQTDPDCHADSSMYLLRDSRQ